MLLIGIIKDLGKAFTAVVLFFAISGAYFLLKPTAEDKYLDQQMKMYPLGFHCTDENNETVAMKFDMKSQLSLSTDNKVYKYAMKNAFFRNDEKFVKEYETLMNAPVYVDSPLAISATEVFRNNMNLFDENVRESELAEHNSNIFVDAVSACAAIVINADNVVKSEEIREYKEFCQAFFTDNLEYAKDRLKFYLANNDKAYVVIEKLKNAKPELKDLLLELLCEIASCDGDFAKCEQDVIDKLVYNLSISSSKWHELKEKYAQTGEEYKILGVSSSASFNEIKAAYHKKCKEFHPDLYQNLPQSFQDFANQKFKEVQEAYEKLRMRYE